MKVTEYRREFGDVPECLFCNQRVERGAVWDSGGQVVAVCCQCVPKLGNLVGDGTADAATPSDCTAAVAERVKATLPAVGECAYRSALISFGRRSGDYEAPQPVKIDPGGKNGGGARACSKPSK